LKRLKREGRDQASNTEGPWRFARGLKLQFLGRISLMAIARTLIGSEMNAMIKPVLRRVALAASIGPAAAGLIFVSESFAQNPLPPPAPGTAEAEPVIVTAEVQRVIVTGSNIPTAEEIGPNPVVSLNRDLINKSGQSTTVEELLKSQPVMGANSIPVQNNASGTGGPQGQLRSRCVVSTLVPHWFCSMAAVLLHIPGAPSPAPLSST